MKKILLLTFSIVTMSFANPVFQWELKANEAVFKSGFEAGIKSLEFQRRNDGYQPKKVKINKAFYITYDITKMPYEEALFLQNIADREGFETYITEHFLYFGQFEREADAKKAVADLQSKFRITAKISKNKGDEFLITYPKLWGDFFTRVVEEAKKSGVIVITEYITTPTINPKAQTSTQYKKRTPAKSAVVTKKFTLKNSKAMAYKKVGDIKNSISFVEKGLVSKKTFIFEKSFSTNQQEKFYKVKNQDTYFSDRDVVMSGDK